VTRRNFSSCTRRSSAGVADLGTSAWTAIWRRRCARAGRCTRTGSSRILNTRRGVQAYARGGRRQQSAAGVRGAHSRRSAERISLGQVLPHAHRARAIPAIYQGDELGGDALAGRPRQPAGPVDWGTRGGRRWRWPSPAAQAQADPDGAGAALRPGVPRRSTACNEPLDLGSPASARSPRRGNVTVRRWPWRDVAVAPSPRRPASCWGLDGVGLWERANMTATSRPAALGVDSSRITRQTHGGVSMKAILPCRRRSSPPPRP